MFEVSGEGGAQPARCPKERSASSAHSALLEVTQVKASTRRNGHMFLGSKNRFEENSNSKEMAMKSKKMSMLYSVMTLAALLVMIPSSQAQETAPPGAF